jgi:hypothetical protein
VSNWGGGEWRASPVRKNTSHASNAGSSNCEGGSTRVQGVDTRDTSGASISSAKKWKAVGTFAVGVTLWHPIADVLGFFFVLSLSRFCCLLSLARLNVYSHTLLHGLFTCLLCLCVCVLTCFVTQDIHTHIRCDTGYFPRERLLQHAQLLLQQGCNANAKAGVNWYCGLHTALVHLFVGILLLSICGVRTHSTTIMGQLIVINGIVGFTRQCYTSFSASSSSPSVRYFFFTRHWYTSVSASSSSPSVGQERVFLLTHACILLLIHACMALVQLRVGILLLAICSPSVGQEREREREVRVGRKGERERERKREKEREREKEKEGENRNLYDA